MLSVPGQTELAKLLVSVVMPAMSAYAARGGMREASPSMSGICMRMSKRISHVDETPVLLKQRSKAAVSGDS